MTSRERLRELVGGLPPLPRRPLVPLCTRCGKKPLEYLATYDWQGDICLGFYLFCLPSCSTNLPLVLDILPRSSGAWPKGPGRKWGGMLLRNFAHKVDAIRCDRCGRHCSLNDVKVLYPLLTVVCKGGCVHGIPRPSSEL